MATSITITEKDIVDAVDTVLTEICETLAPREKTTSTLSTASNPPTASLPPPSPLSLRMKKVHEKAVMPTFAYEKPIGLDLYICDVIATNGIVYGTTGWVMVPPEGYYYKIYPRSSTHKIGWTLANNVAVFDPDYRGDQRMILTPLASYIEEMRDKYSRPVVGHGPDGNEIRGASTSHYTSWSTIWNNMVHDLKAQLPLKVAQLVMEKIPESYSLSIVEELDETVRGERGIGSSGK